MTAGAFFDDQVDEIYDPQWMQEQISGTFETGLTASQMDRAILFFESDVGQTVITLENSARKAFADETIKDMARENYLNGAGGTQLYRLVGEYIDVNDLIEKNVQSSLSSDYNFFAASARMPEPARKIFWRSSCRTRTGLPRKTASGCIPSFW